MFSFPKYDWICMCVCFHDMFHTYICYLKIHSFIHAFIHLESVSVMLSLNRWQRMSTLFMLCGEYFLINWHRNEWRMLRVCELRRDRGHTDINFLESTMRERSNKAWEHMLQFKRTYWYEYRFKWTKNLKEFQKNSIL